MFQNGKIHDVVIRHLKKSVDERGWFAKLFREDEVEQQFKPITSYISVTHPDIVRRGHKDVDQADMFAFIGPSNFEVYLWNTRKNSPTLQYKFVFITGGDVKKSVIIPPGVVHAYKTGGKVLSFPNRLFAGKGKKEPIDEIRHEEHADAVIQLN